MCLHRLPCLRWKPYLRVTSVDCASPDCPFSSSSLSPPRARTMSHSSLFPGVWLTGVSGSAKGGMGWGFIKHSALWYRRTDFVKSMACEEPWVRGLVGPRGQGRGCMQRGQPGHREEAGRSVCSLCSLSAAQWGGQGGWCNGS